MTSPNARQGLHDQSIRRLVYGRAQNHDCLAFADADTAEEEAEEIQAIASARTYGEARAIRTRHVSNPVAIEDGEDPDDYPADDDLLDIHDVGRVADGDWPPMVTTRAFDLLPKDLQARFGGSADTALNGDYLEIPLDCEAEIVAALRERGFEVRRDDKLINILDFNPLH